MNEEQMANQKKRSSMMIALWVGIVVLFVGGVVAIAKYGNQSSVPTPALTETADTDHYEGSKDAKVTLTEYGDFQCPPCGHFYPVVKELHQEYGDKLKIVFRYFPIPQIHQNALAAADAAEAAGKQGKFWEMHNMLFENQDKWAETTTAKDIFATYAQNLSLNMDQYKKDVDSKEVADVVTASYQSGLKAGVQGTPTFFLNGKQLDTPKDVDSFKKSIDDAFTAADQAK